MAFSLETIVWCYRELKGELFINPKHFSHLKRTVDVISSDPQILDVQAQFTKIPFTP